MYVYARARVSGGDCWFRNNAVEGKGRGNDEVWWGLKEAVARDDGREEETGDVYVVVILRVCTRKISIHDVPARANEDANVLVLPYFGCAPGKAEK